MIVRRDFESYEAYVHAQGGKARGNRAELLAAMPAKIAGFRAAFEPALRFLPPGPVLCLGARTGAEAEAFKKAGRSGSLGVDLHPVGEGVRVGDWHSMPEFSDASFPVVYTNSFDHCLYLEKACAEILRILQPGGRFYLMASDKGLKDAARVERWKADRKHNEALFWSKAEELCEAVEACGFRRFRAWKDGPQSAWSHFILGAAKP